MTVLNGIEIDAIEYPTNSTKEAILNNEPIDDVLHVIAVVSNPALFATRYILAKQFLRRMEEESHVRVYVVELAYGSQPFYIADSKNPQHLQLRTQIPLWHKENMVNSSLHQNVLKEYSMRFGGIFMRAKKIPSRGRCAVPTVPPTTPSLIIVCSVNNNNETTSYGGSNIIKNNNPL